MKLTEEGKLLLKSKLFYRWIILNVYIIWVLGKIFMGSNSY